MYGGDYLNANVIWNYLKNFFNEYAIAGIMGNMYVESGLNPQNLQNNGNYKLNMTDEEYVKAVDDGKYNNFIRDGYGFGLCQWTYSGKKANLLNYSKSINKSIGNLETQLNFFMEDLKNYPVLIEELSKVKSVKEASDLIMLKYERPANQTEEAKNKRAKYGQQYYDKFAEGVTIQMANYDKYINSTKTHYISNSGSDENKKYYGGKAGDQTKKEWELRSWYSRPWTHVFRYEKNSNVGNRICELACAAALNDKIGYDQWQRGTYWTQLKKVNYDPSLIDTACEADCSAGVCANVKAVGYLLNIPALQNVSSSMTSRNTISELKKAGFTVLTDQKYRTSSKYLLPGDILLYENHHVATNITKGEKATLSSLTTQNTSVVLDIDPIGTAIALSNMNIREEANSKSNSIGIIRKQEIIKVIEILNNGWYKILYPSSPTGYAYTSNSNNKYYKYTELKSSSNIKKATKKPEAFDAKYKKTFIVTGNSVNVRDGAGSQHSILTTIPKNTKVECDGNYTLYNKIPWYYVTFTYKRITYYGFITSKYVG